MGTRTRNSTSHLSAFGLFETMSSFPPQGSEPEDRKATACFPDDREMEISEL